jgi:hypothetical protein
LCQTIHFAVYIPTLLTKGQCIHKFDKRSQPEDKTCDKSVCMSSSSSISLKYTSGCVQNHAHHLTSARVTSLASTAVIRQVNHTTKYTLRVSSFDRVSVWLQRVTFSDSRTAHARSVPAAVPLSRESLSIAQIIYRLHCLRNY